MVADIAARKMENSWYRTTTAGTLGVNRAEDGTFNYDSVYKWNESSQTGSVMAMSIVRMSITGLG